MLDSESERLAFVRTVAPLLWALLITQLAEWGLDVVGYISNGTGASRELVNGVATVAVAVLLWLIARFRRGWVESLIMIRRVGDYAYTTPDGGLVTPTGTIPGAAPVVRLDVSPHAGPDPVVGALLARNPSATQLRAISARLLEAADAA